MGELVNLRQRKKQIERARRDAEAAANRAAHGRTKAEKERTALESAKAERDLDGKKAE